MRLSSNSYPAIFVSAALAATLAATLACQSAQKTSFLPPAQAQAPALVAASNTPDPPQQKPLAAPAKPQSKPSAPSVDPVADLIAGVEKEYQSGQANYQAGHLEAAKQNFDSAFNQLLGNGFDLHSDDRLEAELDRILDGINGLELAALQQGDGFAEQKSEPAPIDEANELTPAVDQGIKAQAEAEIKSTRSDLPLMMTDQVAGFINYFSTRGRGTVERALARSGRYEDMIRRTLQEEGVPQELIYLAQAESGFHPLAVSRAGARGMWQFMGSRAKGYGLERDWWVDDRQDPEKATRAAAHHLHDLYNQFGDWYLAMAAYNSGPGTVQSAVKRTGYADFWELYRRNVLPKETRNYVPIILAVTIMAKNPAQYGLDSVIKEKPVRYDTVTDRLSHRLSPGRRVRGCDRLRPARPEPQPAADDDSKIYGKRLEVRASPSRRNCRQVSGSGGFDSCRQASLVALSQGSGWRNAGSDRPHLSHDSAGYLRS